MTTNDALLDPTAVIFDLDGTLVDTIARRVASWMRAFAEVGITADEREVGGYIGADGRMHVRQVGRSAGRVVDDELAEHVDRRSGEIFNELNVDPAPLPGARELLLALHESPLHWAIATSSRAEQVAPMIDALELAVRADVTDGSDVAHAKPEPDLLLKSAGQLGVDPAACWYIGDATWDMRASVAAGMTPIGITTGAVDGATLVDAGATVWYASLERVHEDLRRRGLVR